MSVGSIVSGGARLFRNQPQIVAIWMGLYAILMVGMRVAMAPFGASMAAYRQSVAANAAVGAASAPPFTAAMFGELFVMELIFALLMVIAFAAVVRAMASSEGDRFAYLRFGMDELRLIGLAIILAIVSIVAEIVAVLLLVVIGALFSTVLGKSGITLSVILGLVLFCAALYAQVRISLAGALTVMKGRIVIRDAWRATKGHFWTLFGAYVVLLLLYLICTAVIFGVTFALTSPQLLTANALHNPQAFQAAMAASQSQGFSVGVVIQIIVGTLIIVPMGVLLIGGIVEAALELEGPQESIAALFA